MKNSMQFYLFIIIGATCSFLQAGADELDESGTPRYPDDGPDTDVWIPGDGRGRDDWLRCHGFPCDTWYRTQAKLQDLKITLARPTTRQDMVLIDPDDDSLDQCIWLTEEQLDHMLSKLKEELKNGTNQGAVMEVHSPAHSRDYGTERKIRRRRKVTDFKAFPFSLWPTKTIHWKFDGEHNEREREIIRGAFNHWQQQTCLWFKELAINETFTDHHILVTKAAPGCHSFVGRVKVIPQQVNLHRTCLNNLGMPVHEIGHALGLWHEQQRSDRDEAIRVLWNNLGYYAVQFHKQDTDNITPYDYGSVMHYAPTAGSINGKNTMETMDPLYQQSLGQRTGLSFLDAKTINLAYCRDACDVTPPPCRHSGYQDPNDCYLCKCPDGLGGRHCDKVAPPENAVCGGNLFLTSEPLYIESPGYEQTPYDNHIMCSWLVEAPEGSRISLKFEGAFAVYSYYQQQCHHWIEVRYKQNIGDQGPRFCGYRRPNVTVVSQTNVMLIVFKTNWTADGVYSRVGFRAKLELDTRSGSQQTTESYVTSTNYSTRSEKTTSTTTVPPTEAVRKMCDIVDVILVLDSSGGVKKENWNKILNFACSIISQFEIGPEEVRVGVITYSSGAVLSVPLDGTQTISDVTRSVSAIPFQGGATNTHSGFLMMRSHFSSSGRPAVRKVAIHITDGQTARPLLAVQQAAYARSEAIELYVAGIDKYFDYAEAASMVSDRKHIVQIETFDSLASSVFSYGLALREIICTEGITQPSSTLSWSCDFEDETAPFCDMIQDERVDQFDWIRGSGQTPSGSTGPQAAYSGTYYAYIEASDPRQPGDEAILYLPEFGVKGKHCLSFAYNMYGFHVRTLAIRKRTSTGSIVPLWLQAGEQGKDWLTTSLVINLDSGDQLMISAKRGNAYSGDIAIDYLRVSSDKC